jgi:hypothetical protein
MARPASSDGRPDDPLRASAAPMPHPLFIPPPFASAPSSPDGSLLEHPRPIPSRPAFLRAPRPRTNRKDLVSKINLLDLATEVTAVIFRYAHKPKDFHFLLPSGAGPLIPRKYNLPLNVSKEWYRRVRPIYYETLRLTWQKIPDFVENVQRYDPLARYIQSIHVRIVGKAFYKAVSPKRVPGGGEDQGRLSPAQLQLLVTQYIDTPLMTFAICLDSLVCIKDLTLRFTDCKGGEVSLQSKSNWTVSS